MQRRNDRRHERRDLRRGRSGSPSVPPVGLVRVALTAFTLIAGGGLAWAQGATLSSGFGSHASTGNLTGAVDAAILGTTADGSCSGFIANRPSFTLELTEDISNMTVRVASYGYYAGLIVHGPDVRRCTGVPVLDGNSLTGSWPAGRYQIYVSAANIWDYLYYDLYIDEGFPSAVPLPTELFGETFVGDAFLLGEGSADIFGDLEIDPEIVGGLLASDPSLLGFFRTSSFTIADDTSLNLWTQSGGGAPSSLAVDLPSLDAATCTGIFVPEPQMRFDIGVDVTQPVVVEMTGPEDGVFIVQGPSSLSGGPLVHCGSASEPMRIRPDEGSYYLFIGQAETTGLAIDAAFSFSVEQ